MLSNKKVLITTPDYPPLLGGLSTFSFQIEKVLKSLGFNCDLLVWEGIKDLKEKSKKLVAQYNTVFHIHFLGTSFLNLDSGKHIIFYHGLARNSAIGVFC